MKKKETGGACLFFLHPCGKNAAPCRLGWPGANPAERIAAGSEEKARPAYEKAPRPFHRLRAFSELLGGFNLDIVAHLNFLLKLSYIKALCKKENSFHFPYFGGRSRK